MSKLFSHLEILLMMIFLFTCEKSENPLTSINTIDNPILFARYYVNYAWGYKYSGWYVDSDGWIYEVDKNAEIKLGDIVQDIIYSAKMMIDLLESSSKTNKQINKQLLYEMKKLIIPASEGELSESVIVCYDSGAARYITFTRDHEVEGYRAILLLQSGDWTQKNLSLEATQLFKLLREHVEGDTTQLLCSL